MKSLSYISFLFLSILCLTCNNHDPIQPTNIITPVDSAGPAPEALHIPTLFPLASGAVWQYSLQYSYSSQSTSAGPCRATKEFGKLGIEVSKETVKNGGREYELKVNLKIDSLYFAYSYGCGMSFFKGDTAYTRFNALDTTYYRTIVFVNDTLFYKEAGSLSVMMPDSGVTGCTLNPALLDAGRYNVCNRSLSYMAGSSLPNQLVYKVEYPLPWGVQLMTAFVRPEDGGIITLQSFAREGDISHYIEEIQYSLIQYTPGIAFVE